MKNELEHFYIGASYGGNQDWFPTYMMRIGGCGAETACDSSMYFALHRGLSKIAPKNAQQLTREEYVSFAYEMKPYLSPRMTGIDRLEIYIDGYSSYLRDKGEARLSMSPFYGEEPYDKARFAVENQIDRGYPVPTLILNHRNRLFEDYVWHWFLINGYDDSENGFSVKAVTYSGYRWLSLKDLWNTGCRRKGGFVLYDLRQHRTIQGTRLA